MKAAFLSFSSSRNNLPFPSSPLLLPSFQCTQEVIVFKCQRRKEKESERVRENPSAPECHILVRGKKGERTSGRIEEMQFFVAWSLFSSLCLPLCSLLSLLPPPPPGVALKCQRQQFAAERGSLVGTGRPLTCRSGQVFTPCVCLFPFFLRLSAAWFGMEKDGGR